MTIPSNYTDREAFRLTGSLPPERIEKLIDIAEEYKEASDCTGAIDDAIAQYPDEGFLSDIQSRLLDVTARVKGRNRADLLSICAALGDLEMTTFYAAEFGISVLRDLEERLT